AVLACQRWLPALALRVPLAENGRLEERRSGGGEAGAAASASSAPALVHSSTLPLKVRIALHSGTAGERDGDYFGPALNRVARPCGRVAGRRDAAGNLAVVQADRPRARELYERAVAIRQDIGGAAGEADTLGNLARLAQQEGDVDTARQRFEQSLALFEQLGD